MFTPNRDGALLMGRDNFVAAHIKFKDFRNLTPKDAAKKLNKIYDELEGAKRKDTEVRSSTSGRKLDKRKRKPTTRAI
jgi:acyl-CoA reductase-like NAD-dependent aldehyde dehydrogenase